MPSFTPFLNLYKPGGGSSGLITPDEVVDVDRLNANSDLIDGWAQGWGLPTARNHQFRGPAAGKASVTGMVLGDTYQETDGSQIRWRYNGSDWLPYSTGYINVTYSAGWSTGAAGGQYRIANGIVFLNGRIQAAAGVGGDTMFILPPEARPASQSVESVWDGTNWLDVIIDTNGAVNQFGRGTTARSDIRLATINPFPVASL